MNDKIHLLPDAVANQIAAGEVVVGPYSVIKELMENAVDAGASHVTVVIKGAGRTSIQVVDDGCGMTPSDAMMALQRHATSKITSVEDLYTLQTMGFRGEALPSIVSVSQVEIKTKTADEELGTLIEIDGSKVVKNEEVAAPVGTSITVKNLFYNVPARRKFLKSDETETRRIIAEFQRVALATPQVAFTLFNGTTEVYNLPAENQKQRIVGIFGKKIKHYNDYLIPFGVKNGIASISGFVGTPESSSKNANQMFFVNGRFMRHPYFHKAVMQAYDRMIAPDCNPHYFIYFDINPQDIDINVHPTKTEIKFENEREIWQILLACVRESLGKFNIMPSLQFDSHQEIEIPVADTTVTPTMPTPKFDPNYNPFKSSGSSHTSPSYSRPSVPRQWDTLFTKQKETTTEQESLGQQSQTWDNSQQTLNLSSADNPQANNDATLFNGSSDTGDIFLFRNRYVMTAVKSGLMIIDYRRALERILFDELMLQLQQQQCVSQQILFPEVWELTPEAMPVYENIKEDLHALGFQLEPIAQCAFSIIGIPAVLTSVPRIPQVLNTLLAVASEEQQELKRELYEPIVAELAATQAAHTVISNNKEELQRLINKLFATTMPNISPKGKNIVSIMPDQEITQWLG